MSFSLTDLARDYGDIIGEAAVCRKSAAVFDFSFMSRVRVAGPYALAAVQTLTQRNLSDLSVGRLRYCLRQTSSGHVAVDLTIWRVGTDTFEVMSGRHQDIANLLALAPAATDLSDACVIYALQGPNSLDVLSEFADRAALAELPYFGCTEVHVIGVPCLVGRLGYTGEAGFEIIAPKQSATELWNALTKRVPPAGFAAADILRIEAGFILFANELSLPVKAHELGLATFSGEAEVRENVPISLVAFTAEADTRPVLWQPHTEVRRPQRPGEITVTSACWSPLVGAILGLGYACTTDEGASLRDENGVFHEIRRIERPYYDPQKLRPRAPWR